MKQTFLIPVVGCLFPLLACGGKAVVDAPSQGGAGQGGAGQGGQRQSTSDTVSSGQGGTVPVSAGPGPGGMQTSGFTAATTTGGVNQTGPGTTTGGGSCNSCAQFITACTQGDCPDPSTLCPGSDKLFKQLFDCVCLTCAKACGFDCSSNAQPCQDCKFASIQSSCQGEFAQCASDF